MPHLPAALAVLTLVFVHDWYPSSCCGGSECQPVPCDQLVEARGGWLYLPTGNYFHEAQVQPSPDRNCHVCIMKGGDHRSLCAFIQMGT
jgi:hypothetical protein